MATVCQKCGKRPANVHLKQVINGIAHEEYLCSQCAAVNGSVFGFGFEKGADNLFDSLFSSGNLSSARSRRSCPLCGATARDINGSGRAGCAKCYEVFREELGSAAYRIHGGAKHVGRAPGNHKEEMERQAKIEALKNEQAKAIEEQNYERAAELRDEIKALLAERSVKAVGGDSADNNGDNAKGGN